MQGYLGRMVMAVCCCLLCAATVYGKSLNRVFLKDGGVIECRSFRLEKGTVRVVVNRDLAVDLPAGEVDLKRTMAHRHRPMVKKAAAAAKTAPAGKGETVAAPAGAPEPAKVLPGGKPVPRPSVQKPAAPAPPGARPAPVPAAPAPPGAKPAPVPASPPPAAKPAPPTQSPGAAPPVKPAPPSGRTTLPMAASKPPVPKPAALPAMFGMGVMLPLLAVLLLLIASFWKVFTKAGEAGWQSIIPIYNLFVLVKISGKPWWWFLLFLVPVVSVIIHILVHIALAERFGKGVLYGLGLAFLGFIFFPMLAFGSAEYQ